MREQRDPTRRMIATKTFWETEGHEEGRGVEAPALLRSSASFLDSA